MPYRLGPPNDTTGPIPTLAQASTEWRSHARNLVSKLSDRREVVRTLGGKTDVHDRLISELESLLNEQLH